jgi:hypothetical protein
VLAVHPEDANHQWRKNLPGPLPSMFNDLQTSA